MKVLSQTLTDAEETHRCHEAFHILKDTILGEDSHTIDSGAIEFSISVRSGVTLTMGALGSSACDLWTKGDSVRISVAGTPSRSTFYLLARSRLRSTGSKIVIEDSDTEDDIMFRLNINTARFLISYHQVSKDRLDWVWSTEDIPSNISASTRRRFTDRSNTMRLRRIFQGSEHNRECCLWLKLWAKCNGLYSSAFGLLTDDMILEMAAANISDLQATRSDPWSKERFFLSLSNLYNGTYTDSQQAPFKAPRLSRDSFSGVAVLDEIECLPRNLNPPKGDGFSRFTSTYPTYLAVDLSYWGISKVKRDRYLEAVQIILAGFLKRLAIRLFPKLQLRPWPERLVPRSLEHIDAQIADQAYYKATYLVGASYDDEIPDDVISSLPTLLRDEIVRNKHYDMNLAYVDVTWIEHVGSLDFEEELEGLGPLPEERKPGSHDDDEDDEPNEDHEEAIKKKPVGPTKVDAGISQLGATDSASRTPLRPALAVLHRIKNDHAMDSADYVVGYLDRHTGIKEMPAEWWILKEETAEDFIPQSRIRYFKRVSDGVTMWDREARLDLVFGSGQSRR
ncbi:MAG: hypothetical protein MMC23_002636 [Stictis urceolatum]|nr:hypothetical protein [Stictis urceolata]